MGLGDILESIKDAVTGNHHDEQVQTTDDQTILPASQDPYGDPADQGTVQNASYEDGGILPASQDPYGDPADAENADENGILPASQDPLGDPADDRR